MRAQHKTKNSIERVLFRPKEAAIVLGTSTSWVYARVSDGSLPAVRLGGRMVRIRRDDLMEFAGGVGQEAGPR